MNSYTTETILESISDGVFSVDHDRRIHSFNRAAEKITGISRDKAIGKPCWEVFRSNMCQGECLLKKTLNQGRSFISTSTYIINHDNRYVPVSVATSLLMDKYGNVLGGVETFRDLTVEHELRKELSGRFRIEDIISKNAAMQKLFDILPRISESDSNVLIKGETGTGKELMAKAIHNLSFRKDKPFTALNCGALPDALLESELFGYKAGAFTSAVKDKPGLFATANGGTILLDEIGETSPACQMKLLRVLEAHEFHPLGGVHKERTDVRILAATNTNLGDMIKKKTFRKDLFYRINVVLLDLPPLRDRMEDLPLLIGHFIAKYNRIRGKSVKEIAQNALELLMSHDFPGNIRELENIIEHAFILCSHGNIQQHHLPDALCRHLLDRDIASPFTTSVQSMETELIKNALKKNRYNRKAAAADLGIHKSTLFRKINKFSIALPKTDGRSRP
ncbi:MAG: sigma 54-interacting transcriptional regulator [Desulfobacteraceae bacterium]